MSILYNVRKQLAARVVKGLRHDGRRGMSSQTVTISVGSNDMERFWRDPERLSQVFGDVATVSSPENEIFVWTLSIGTGEAHTWRTRLHTADGELRFVAVSGDDANSDSINDATVVVRYRSAPVDMGTEVTLKAATPFPDLFTETVLFKALYRARALLQTGEAPTLSNNPSARKGAH